MISLRVAPKASPRRPPRAGGAGAEEGAFIPKSPAYWDVEVAIKAGAKVLLAYLRGARARAVAVPEVELAKLVGLARRGAPIKRIVAAELPHWQALPKYVRTAIARELLPKLA